MAVTPVFLGRRANWPATRLDSIGIADAWGLTLRPDRAHADRAALPPPGPVRPTRTHEPVSNPVDPRMDGQLSMDETKPGPNRPLAAGRLWAGGAATALVAALFAVLGILVARGLFGVSILAPKGDGVWGDVHTATYALLAAAATLLATALLHGLLLITPQATRFFGWIMTLITLIAMVMPLALLADLDSRVGTALLNLVLGLVITSLLVGVAHSARVPRHGYAVARPRV